MRGIRRREFLTVVGGAAEWPLAAEGQQPAMPVVGFLNGGSPDGYAPYVAAFHEGLKQTGYIEAQNVAIEHRWAVQASGSPGSIAHLRGARHEVGWRAPMAATLPSPTTGTNLSNEFEGKASSCNEN